MERVYLGLFEKVFNWVLSRIVEPVYRFVSGLLMTVFSWIFEEILAPVLMPVLEEALQFFIDLWLEIYSNHLYMLFSGVLKLIDYLETAFDVFIGLRDVTYTEPGGGVVTGSLVEVLMQQKAVNQVFWAITLGALGLALLLTIYGTAKSAFDLDFENKRPVSKVLTAMMKTFIQFFTVPFLVYFMVKLSSAMLRGVTGVLNFGSSTSLGRIVFMIASLNAAKNDSFNVGSAKALNIEFGVSSADTVRYPFYTLTGGNGVTVKDYGNIKQVTEVFRLADFDYIIGFIAAVFLLFTIGVCLIVFVQRIFEMMLLYLVSPYFVCMIPLDDGERFGRWRDMFIGKCFTGFGSVIGMRLFLMICPMVMGNRIRFGTAASPEMDYMMKLFFLAGGAWAVYKSGSMITSLLSHQAGASESETSAVAGGMIFGHTAGMVMAKGQQALSAGLSRRGAGAGGGPGRGDGGTGPEAGRFGGGRTGEYAGMSSPGRPPGIGKKIKNTAAAGREVKTAFQGLKNNMTGQGKSFRGAARHMARSYDSLSNLSRAVKGQEKSSGLEARVDESISAFRRGASALGRDFDTTEKSMRGSVDSFKRTARSLAGPGSLRDKARNVAETTRSIYGTTKQFGRIGEDYGKMKAGVREGIHYKVNMGAFQYTAASDGSVLAKKFPGREAEAPKTGALDDETIRRDLADMGLEGSIESAPGSQRFEGSPSILENIGESSSGPTSVRESSPVPESMGEDSGPGWVRGRIPQPRENTWKAGTVPRNQIRCVTVPTAGKVSARSRGVKVTYRSLSVQGLKYSGQRGKITRRNSI